ncbi:hypothetical protein [Microbulbifer spongiae]|uniref:Zinc-binding domain-containing protein n=1 Tax=Microbulbifer spongiae TaxID=2944933 RepID=A0ABY9E7Y4_9GAMM|nr:hypothetical protein [Microbulbifer sp. MI-G]WKD48213.1 hypothetical protein M8T91_09700 [Microbulbifer sp. MI-G]
MTRKTNEQGQFYCRGCNQWQAPEAFPLNTSRFSRCGRASRCKRCRAAYQQTYRIRQGRDSHIRTLIQRRSHQFF